jgi:hypothetical protein
MGRMLVAAAWRKRSHSETDVYMTITRGRHSAWSRLLREMTLNGMNPCPEDYHEFSHQLGTFCALFPRPTGH